MYITGERMDVCKYFIEMIAVRLKKRFLFEKKHATAERITQTKDDCNSSCQSKYSTLQRMDGYHSFYDKGSYTASWDGWPNRISKIDLPKNKLFLINNCCQKLSVSYDP